MAYSLSSKKCTTLSASENLDVMFCLSILGVIHRYVGLRPMCEGPESSYNRKYKVMDSLRQFLVLDILEVYFQIRSVTVIYDTFMSFERTFFLST